MVATELHASHGANITVNRGETFSQGGLEGIISVVQDNPLFVAGGVIALIVLIMVFSGGGIEEEIAQQTAQEIAGEVT